MAPQPSNIAKKRANLVKALSTGWSSNNSNSNSNSNSKSNTKKKRASNNKPVHTLALLNAVWNQTTRRNNAKKAKKETTTTNRFSWV